MAQTRRSILTGAPKIVPYMRAPHGDFRRAYPSLRPRLKNHATASVRLVTPNFS